MKFLWIDKIEKHKISFARDFVLFLFLYEFYGELTCLVPKDDFACFQ